MSLDYSYYQSDYLSRTLAVSCDLTRKYGQHETVFEGDINNQSIKLPGASEGISRYKYDANIKRKYFYADTPYYSYLSPRIRHNDSGYFTSAQAMRIGGGRKIFLDESHFDMSFELGVGYRYATLADQSNIKEQLLTLATKFSWDISPNITIKFNLTNEQSALEKYRTVTLELKSKLTQDFSIKTEIAENRTYPFDISVPNGELISSMGIDYEI